MIRIENSEARDVDWNRLLLQNSDDDFATFSVAMQGLSANQNHGFHVHQFGDLGSDCMNTGGHYDPPSSVVREVGDLGHLTADAA